MQQAAVHRPSYVARNTRFVGHVGRHIVCDQNVIRRNRTLIDHPDAIVDRIAGLYVERLVVGQQLDQGQVVGQRGDRGDVMMVVIFALSRAIAVHSVVLQQGIVIRIIVILRIHVHHRCSVRIGCLSDFCKVIHL